MSTICRSHTEVSTTPPGDPKGRYRNSTLRTHVSPFGLYILDRLDERPHLYISSVAHYLNISRNRLNRCLDYPRGLSFGEVIAIGEFLGCPLQELLVSYLVSIHKMEKEEQLSSIADLLLLVESYLHVPEKYRHLALGQARGLLKAYSEEPSPQEEEKKEEK